MVAEVFAGISAFNSMFNIAKSIRDMDNTVARNAAISDLWEQIFAAQTRYAAAAEQVATLEKEVTGLKAWNTDKERYKLSAIRPGVVAFSLKEGMENGEPPHQLCASCYQGNFKSILTQETWQPGRCDVLVCHDCGWYAYKNGMADPAHKNLRPKPYRGD